MDMWDLGLVIWVSVLWIWTLEIGGAALRCVLGISVLDCRSLCREISDVFVFSLLAVSCSS